MERGVLFGGLLISVSFLAAVLFNQCAVKEAGSPPAAELAAPAADRGAVPANAPQPCCRLGDPACNAPDPRPECTDPSCLIAPALGSQAESPQLAC
jgi:hypothetical protein